jgi:hypothetical protein
MIRPRIALETRLPTILRTRTPIARRGVCNAARIVVWVVAHQALAFTASIDGVPERRQRNAGQDQGKKHIADQSEK